MKTIWMYSLVLLAGLFPAQSSFGSTITWDWTYTSDGYSGGGSFTTASTTVSGTSEYLVSDVTGIWNGAEITGIATRGSFGGNDNLIFASLPQLDFSGLAFTTATGEYNMFYTGSKYEVCLTVACTGGVSPGMFSATPAPVPEPSFAILDGIIALGAMAFGWQQRRRRSVAAAW